jgi:hypothetical protein
MSSKEDQITSRSDRISNAAILGDDDSDASPAGARRGASGAYIQVEGPCIALFEVGTTEPRRNILGDRRIGRMSWPKVKR